MQITPVPRHANLPSGNVVPPHHLCSVQILQVDPWCHSPSTQVVSSTPTTFPTKSLLEKHESQQALASFPVEPIISVLPSSCSHTFLSVPSLTHRNHVVPFFFLIKIFIASSDNITVDCGF